MENLIFEQTNRGVVLIKSNSAASYVTVPNCWNDQPVCEIGKYAFANQPQLKRVTLPAGICCIDNHAFYNCTALEQLNLQSGLHSVGDGAFKNCRNLHSISVHGLTGLKSIVTDFTNEITLTITTKDGQTVVLLFPEYDYAFQEVIPPREFRSVTYGSGSFYRMCVTRTGINFNEYDQTFSRAVIADEPEIVQKIALYRLMYPYQLREKHKETYIHYIRKHVTDVLKTVLAERSIPKLELLLRYEIPNQEVMEDAIASASQMDFPEGVSLLMDDKLARFGRPSSRYRL